MQNAPLRPLWKAAALTALLVSCGQQGSAPQTQATPFAVQTRDFAYVTTVSLSAGDTQQSLEREFGGEVAAFDEQAGYALIATNQKPALSAQSTQRRQVVTEANQGRFTGGSFMATMGGRRSIWSGGDTSASLGGRRSIWSGGQYLAVAENTPTWKQINLERGHALAPRLGEGVKVAVIDTGIDLAHPAFQGTLAPQTDWWDFYGNDASPQEEGSYASTTARGYGHGTSVAGIVLQVAPNAKIIPLRVLGPDGSGDVLGVTKAIDWAVAKGAKVINLSLGSTSRTTAVQDAIKRATTAGVLVVSSAGNENLSAITYPAYDAATGTTAGYRSLGVGSVDAYDRKSSFSNYGRMLETVAPGENVYGPAPENQMASWSGTSMAAPMAAGAMALALGQGLKVALSDVTMKMAENGFDLYNNGMNEAYKDMLGKRRLDVAAFLSNVAQ